MEYERFFKDEASMFMFALLAKDVGYPKCQLLKITDVVMNDIYQAQQWFVYVTSSLADSSYRPDEKATAIEELHAIYTNILRTSSTIQNV